MFPIVFPIIFSIPVVYCIGFPINFPVMLETIYNFHHFCNYYNYLKGSAPVGRSLQLQILDLNMEVWLTSVLQDSDKLCICINRNIQVWNPDTSYKNNHTCISQYIQNVVYACMYFIYKYIQVYAKNILSSMVYTSMYCNLRS